MLRLLALSALSATVLATTFEKCSENEPVPAELRLSNCNRPPCQFVRGKELVAEVDFIPDHDITGLKPYVQAIVLGFPVDYTLPQINACKSLLEKTCPLTKDEKVTYELRMPILSSYPPIPLTVKHALIDSSTDQMVTCFKITGRVV